MTQRFPPELVTSSNNFIDINGSQSDNTKAIAVSNSQAGADSQADKGQKTITALFEKLSMVVPTCRELRRELKIEKQHREEDIMLLKSEIANLKMNKSEIQNEWGSIHTQRDHPDSQQ